MNVHAIRGWRHHQQKVDRVPVVLPMQNSMAGVIFQQMRHARSIRQFVDCHHGNFRPASDSYKARTTLRPMRPKPFIATRTVIDLLQRFSLSKFARQSNPANRPGKPYLSQTATDWLIVEHLID